MKGNWDKIVLIVSAVIVTGLSGWFATKALAFKNQFDMVANPPKGDFPQLKTPQTDVATRYVQRATDWSLPAKGTPPKPLPLFVSIPIVEIEGDTIDMLNPDARQIRPPVSNEWLLSNNLDFLNKSVLQLDPDRDGYTNLEEWTGKTDPRDSGSHPPYADKLVMKKRHAQVYRAMFAARPDDKRFQIRRLRSSKWPKPDNFYLTIGETSKDSQIRLDAFEEKTAQSNIGITVDASVLSVTFLPKGTKHTLVRNVAEDIPTYYAELEFLLDKGKTFFVKEGDTFPLAVDPGTKYRLIEVTENSAKITYETAPGTTETVEINRN